MRIKSVRQLLSLCFLVAACCPSVHAQGTAFTYQGRLTANGSAANGNFDLTFLLFNISNGGSAVAGPMTNTAVAVSNGVFTATVDFGAGVFAGGSNWLEIAVRTNGSDPFTTLTPRQQLTPSPYAIFAGASSNLLGQLPAGQLNGIIPNGNLPPSPNFAGTVAASSFQSSGGGGSFVAGGANNSAGPYNAIGGGEFNTNTAGFATIGGGYNNKATNSLYITVGGGRFNVAGANDATIAGGVGNTVTAAAGTIGGGYNNVVSSNNATVGGGQFNYATNQNATVGGGQYNTAGGDSSTVPGGANNLASGNYSFAAGYGAQATNTGAFVWADAAGTAFTSTTNNQFRVRAGGGVQFVTGGAGITIDGQPVLAGTIAQLVTNNEGGVHLTGSFAGSASGLTNLQLSGVGPSGTFGLVPSQFSYNESTYPVGTFADLAALADVNGDGLPDLISANDGDNSLTVYTNVGGGMFRYSATLGVGSGPFCVAAADVNGDNKVDLISSDFNSQTLTVLTNDGSGGFAFSATLNVGTPPVYVIAADVNFDGSMDLITANQKANTLTIFTNNGSGVFGLNANLPVGNGPTYVAAADINGDHLRDLISANFYTHTLTVYTNSLNKVFGSNATINVGNGPICIAAADINLDGKTDLISANNNDSTLTVLLNNGNGTFTPGATVSVGGGPNAVIVAYLNDDDYPDLVTANGNVNSLSLLTNNGAGGFKMQATLLTGNSPNSIAAADLNGDNLTDFVCANSGDNSVSVFVTGTSAISTADSVSLVGTGNEFGGSFDLTLGGHLRLNDQPMYLRGDGDVNHGLAYAGSGVPNFGPTILPDGPVLWGFTGGVLGTASGGQKAILSWNTSGVQINGSFVGTASIVGNGSGLTNLNASQLSGTIADARLSLNVPLLNGTQTFSGRNSFSQGIGVGTTSTLEGDLNINTSAYLFSHTLYLRGETGTDHNHGLAYSGNTITNFGTGQFQVDGPILWGYAGGVLGTRSGGDHAAVQWSSTSVTVNGTFNNNSDRNAKQDFAPVSATQILEQVSRLPLSEWSYKIDADTRHIGPMAQDFYAAFNVGTDEKHIAPIDEGGVALAAIQGLNQKVEVKSEKAESEIQQLKTENAELKQRLAALEKILLQQKPN
jgi:hypothetical protein